MAEWEEAKEEIYDILNADAFRPGGKWAERPLKWANRVIRDICMEIDIRFHLQLSCTRTFTTSDASVSLPDTFFKMSNRFTRARVGEDYIDIINLEKLYEFDPDHDATTDNDQPDRIAIEGNRLYVHPKFAGDIVVENWFRSPVDMTGDSSKPDLPDDTVMEDLLIAGVCRKGFRLLADFEMKREYDSEYAYYLDLYRHHTDKSNSKVVVKAKDY